MHNDLKFAAIGVVPGGQLDVTTYRPAKQKTKESVKKEEWQEWNNCSNEEGFVLTQSKTSCTNPEH